MRGSPTIASPRSIGRRREALVSATTARPTLWMIGPLLDRAVLMTHDDAPEVHALEVCALMRADASVRSCRSRVMPIERASGRQPPEHVQRPDGEGETAEEEPESPLRHAWLEPCAE